MIKFSWEFHMANERKNKHMKTYIFFLIFLLGLSSSALSEVYVSKDGSDTNDGSFSNPFKTIQKASDVMPAGGTCYIREGVYRETVTVTKENQTFTNYNDEYVLVTGLDVVEGWSEYKEGIYQAPFTFSELQFTQLFVNGQYQQMARYPDNTTGKMMDMNPAMISQKLLIRWHQKLPEK